MNRDRYFLFGGGAVLVLLSLFLLVWQDRLDHSVPCYQGKPAAYWGSMASNRYAEDVENGFTALAELRSDGVAQHLAAIEAHDETFAIWLGLTKLDGALLKDQDLPRLLPYLGNRYAEFDDHYYNIRLAAVNVLIQAGPKVRFLLPELKKKLLNTPYQVNFVELLDD